MFGAIPKGQRLRYHNKYRQLDDFNQMLIDVFSTMRPGLTIIDGIVAMEGMGPAAGSLKNLGIILASQDTVALDTVVMKITGLEPQSNLITNLADKRGLGISNLANIDIVGESLSDVAVTDFKYPDTQQIARIFMRRAPKFMTTFVNNLSVVKPRVINKLCIGCLECKKTCPANAISIVNDKASINHQVCIMCYCCHEACRSNAILVKQVVYKRIMRYLIKTSEIIAGKVIKKILRKS
jgi:formate hydrogenlyase subunit 6/NADH:ubiquinone oxidoreductase subunit I